ncbi:MAG: hypothetical protein ACMZ64_00190 [Oleiphilus sp.]
MSIKPERHGLLKALGVKQWYSRFVLKGAADTPLALFKKTDAVSGKAESSVSQAAFVDPVVSRAPIKIGKELIEDITGLTESSNAATLSDDSASEPLVTPIESSGNSIPALELSLSCFGEVLVFNESMGSQGLDREAKLQENVLSSVGLIKAVQMQSQMHFKWPVFESPIIDNAQRPFFESIIRRWVSTVKWSDIKFIFYFGQHIHTIEPAIVECQQSHNVDSRIIHFGASLGEVMASPLKKKSLWMLLSKTGVVSD